MTVKKSVVPRQRVGRFRVVLTLHSDISLYDWKLIGFCNGNGLFSL